MKHDSAFFEREYNARATIPEHPQIFAHWAEQAAITRRLRACLIDLPFGETAAERLDYFPTRQEAAPLLVFIHGGYWRSLDKSDFSWLAPPFVQHGVALALLNYGLAPATPMEEIVRQQIRALAWLYRNGDRLGFDPERIVVAGHEHVCGHALEDLVHQRFAKEVGAGRGHHDEPCQTDQNLLHHRRSPVRAVVQWTSERATCYT